MQFEYRVIITSAGGYLGPQNVKYLKKSIKDKVWVLAVDVNENINAKFYADKFCKVPKGNSKEYIKVILKLSKRYNINCILPCSDEEAFNLSKNKLIFEDLGITVFCQSFSTTKIISNKIKTYEVLKKNNVKVPYYKVVNDKKELLIQAKNIFKKNFSFVIKNPSSRGNRGVFVVSKQIRGKTNYMGSRETHISFSYFIKHFNNYFSDGYPKLISEKLYTPCYDLDTLSTDGNLLVFSARKRINPAGVPYKGNILYSNKKLEKIAKKVVRIFNISWLVDIDIMSKKDGSLVVLEINPRPSGSCLASIISGIQLYEGLLKLKNKKKLSRLKVLKKPLKVVPSISCNVINE